MKAMILAAGEGRRMRPLTLDAPKPLLRVNGKSLIEYHIESLKSVGIVDLVINIAYLGEKIKQALGSGEHLGVSIQYSQEPEPLETGGAILHALPLLGKEPFVLVNGDVWTDYDFSLLKKEALNDRLAHLVLVDNPEHNPSGDFSIGSEGLLNELSEATLGDIGLTFCGLSLLNPMLFDTYPKKRQKFPLVEVFYWGIQQKNITAEYYNGIWTDVGTPERLQSLQEV